MREMKPREQTRISKFLSLVLRHQPELLGLELSGDGWVDTDLLVERCAAHGRPLTRAQLEEVVEANPKKRFAFSADGKRIRASQRHSVAVELGYDSAEPPTELFHGTVARNLEAIFRDGLQRRKRHAVHLSSDIATALNVGGRRGKPVLLRVEAQQMVRDGYRFQVSDNGVWLTEHVPARYIRSVEDKP